MSPPRELSPARHESTIRQAIEKQARIVATFNRGDVWLVAHSRFLPHNPGHGLLCLQPFRTEAIGDVQPEEITFEEGTALGISFRRGHNKCMFSTRIAGMQRITINADTKCQAVLIKRPESIQELQRRVYHRVVVAPENAPTVALLPLKNELLTAAPFSGQPILSLAGDVSAGGVRVRLPENPDWSPTVGDGFLLTISPDDADQKIEINAIYRHCHIESDGALYWGFQLVGMEGSAEGRERLNRLTKLIKRLHRLG